MLGFLLGSLLLFQVGCAEFCKDAEPCLKEIPKIETTGLGF